MTEWKTDPPTVPGFYWAIHRNGPGLPCVVEVDGYEGAEMIVRETGSDMNYATGQYSHWLQVAVPALPMAKAS